MSQNYLFGAKQIKHAFIICMHSCFEKEIDTFPFSDTSIMIKHIFEIVSRNKTYKSYKTIIHHMRVFISVKAENKYQFEYKYCDHTPKKLRSYLATYATFIENECKV